ncbi:alpha-amylase family glycosyl hydrolase [Zunongwangia endophytica]|uniref:Alpha-amylase family glycosyl hydrolase n=1 Tax=Zunongwangia endophytica TaxID=1808945 RepID=A0ABV8HCS5_9FLAO|nr:alpha-amylase family glycosyl hydrolase [Zunongwangia endophytica]MDN3593581.1 alpha-amylase family glycosyl hydrolase [Zunongwangia endophytica]
MKRFIIAALALTMFAACKNEASEKPVKNESEKAQKLAPINDSILGQSVIYEANIRQYSPEGTFNEFTKDIPQLKELGVKVIWLMPVYPISSVKRKAADGRFAEEIEDPKEREKILGSYYAISDYTGINPEFGTLQDFQKLVKTAHENDIYVILDWVANHTGWDHIWIKEHPEFYTKNEAGEIIDPINPETGESWGWTDVADLSYDNKELWDEMRKEMRYWVEEQNIDGFRCDVAGEVPTEFWESAVKEIKQVKPIFMLAESEDKDLFEEAFDMGYNWEGHHILNAIAQGEQNAKDLSDYMEKIDTTYQEDDYLMNFVTNHDENSWNGTLNERMGDAAEVMTALTFTLPGMPLIYSGQEYDMQKRLRFFEKDTINHQRGKFWPILSKLGSLKNESPALDGSKTEADFLEIKNLAQNTIFSFKRKKNNEEVIFIGNLSGKDKEFKINLNGEFIDYMNNEKVFVIEENQKLLFSPWEYKILINR